MKAMNVSAEKSTRCTQCSGKGETRDKGGKEVICCKCRGSGWQSQKDYQTKG